jgi:hypothetical protein
MKISNLKHFVKDSAQNANPVSLRLSNALFAELLNFGIIAEESLLERVSKLSPLEAYKFCESVATEYTPSVKLNPPLFKNWEERTVFSFEERVIQILGYVFQICGNDFNSPRFYKTILKNVKFDKFKALTLASDSEARDYVENLFGAKVSQDRKTQLKMVEAAQFANPAWLRDIKSDEARAAAIIACAEFIGLGAALEFCGKTPADALRFAAGKRDFAKVKLPSDVLYAPLKWGERVASIRFMDEFDFDFLSEGIGNNREAWVRYFNHVHLLGQKDFLKRFKNACAAFYIGDGNRLDAAPQELRAYIKSLVVDGSVEVTLNGSLAYRTFASRMARAIENQDYHSIAALGKKRPNYVLRNLSTVSQGVSREYLNDFRKFVKGLLPNASVDVLFSILSIDVSAEWRIIDVKGDTRIEKADYNPIIKDIQADIENVIRNKWGYSEVSVQSGLEDAIVPFLSKNANLARGTKIDVSGAKYLYFYVHWVENNQRTDIDHSFICFDGKWASETVYFGRQANSYIAQSGDITSAPAPNGATEYAKISLGQIPKNIKYICATINSFTMNTFDTNKTVRAGFMKSNSDSFEMNREHNSYNLDQPAAANVPFILDVERQQVVILDVNFRDCVSRSIHGYSDSLKNMIKAVERKNYISLGRLAAILSGGPQKGALKIVERAASKDEVEPESLFAIFS